jgi:hypothetical protein
MSTTPPESPGGGTTPGAGPGLGGWTVGSPGSVARLPVPGNAEFALYVLVEIIFVLIWIFAKTVNTFIWVELTTVLTAFYLLSRGIAKASRVLEQ